MDAPKPSAHWGRWRFQPVRVAGHPMVPAAKTPGDQQIIRHRLNATSRSTKDNDEHDLDR